MNQTKLELLKSLGVSTRTDGYINATELCKTGGKSFGHWYKLKRNKELIIYLENEVNEKVVKIENKIFFIHPDLEVIVRAWVNPSFALLISQITFEILIKGRYKIN